MSAFRDLTAEELELVSGGEIVITGHPYSSWTYSGFFDGMGADDGYGSGGWDSRSEHTEPEALPTPCVETQFSTNASLQDANNAALKASNAIAALNDETYEYSSIIWSLNGTVGWTTPFKGSTDDVNWLGGISQVPDGAVI